MRLIVITIFLFVFSLASAQNNVTVYASATNVSTWYGTPCDGTFTFWIEGTSQPYYHEYTITGPGGPYTITTIDTIVTLTGLCPGDYWGNVTWNSPCYDTSLINNCAACNPYICPTNPVPCPVDSCTNCSGAAGGSGGAGAGATVGAPLGGEVSTYLPPCKGSCAYNLISVGGGTPPYSWSCNGGSGTIASPGFNNIGPMDCCSNILGSLLAFYQVTLTDATGQSVILNELFLNGFEIRGIHYCGSNPYPVTPPNIEVCAGETITFNLEANNWSWPYIDPNANGGTNYPLTYSLSSSNSQIGLPSNQQIQAYGQPSYVHTISYTAPQVTSTQVSNLSCSANFGNSCPSPSEYFTITIHPLPIVDAGSYPPICEGIPMSVSGSGALSYAWDNGVSDNVAFSPSAGNNTYTVIGTDVNGCENSDQTDVLVYALPNVFAGQDLLACDGGQVILSATTSEIPTWDNGVVDGNPFVVSSGVQTYTVSVTDANTCQNSDQVDVTTFALPLIDAGADQTICDGGTVTLAGSGGNSYLWDNGVTDNVSFTQALGTVSYTVEGTDMNGCVGFDVVDVLAGAPDTLEAGPDQTICPGQSLILSGSGGQSYAWDNGVQDGVSFNPQLGMTSYTVTDPGNLGCSVEDQVTITVAEPFVDGGPDLVACDGDQLTLVATTSESPSWDNGVVDGSPFNVLAGIQTYTVSVTDVFGCQNSDQVIISTFGLPTIDAGANQLLCETDWATLTGSGGVSYAWDNGILDNSPFTPPLWNTTYTVIGTDANGCQNSDQVDLLVNPLPLIDAGSDQTICNGDPIVLSGSGATSYVWDNGVSDNVLFIPPAGTTLYEVTGTDMNGCQNTDQVVVNTTALPTIDAGLTQTICEGELAILSGSGGVSYVWDNGVSDSSPFSPLVGTTTYSVIGTDANGCENTDVVDVVVNPLPTVDAGTNQSICDGGQITLSGSGASSYVWDNGVSENVPFTPSIGTTTYSVIGTDAHGCENSDLVDVTVNPLPQVSAGSNQDVCVGDAIILSGAGANSYAWTNGVIDGQAFTQALGSVTYDVTGTDVNGCSNTSSITISVHDIPSINGGPDLTVCFGASTVLSATGNGTITWNGSLANGSTYFPSTTLTQLICTADDFGCQNSDTILVTMTNSINTNLTINVGELTADPGYVNYQWIDCNSGISLQNGIQNVYTITQDGLYKVVITDSYNCVRTSDCFLIDYLAMNGISSNEPINLFPNPTSGKVFISNGQQLESIMIIDGAGRVVGNLDGEISELDLSDLENGQYFIQMTTIDRHVIMARVIKQ